MFSRCVDEINSQVWRMDALPWEATLSNLFCLPFKKGSLIEEKKNTPRVSTPFPFKVCLFSKGTRCAGKLTGSHRDCPHFKTGGNSTKSGNVPSDIPSEVSEQPAHSKSLFRVFSGRILDS